RLQAFTGKKVVNALALKSNARICSSSPSRLMLIAVDLHLKAGSNGIRDMSVRMALAKLCACTVGGAIVGGGAVHVSETPPPRPAIVKQDKRPLVRRPVTRRVVRRTVHRASC